ncbi:hypothetical protein AWB85_15520 [Mycobacteroides immunogenum]|uniref:HTH tetR-type domain-containing protein n=1 Tax=Mycobacteroides immunogenum TaxID=83262 RepID=A0A179V523_9MYCO|nr:hypothetical protein AWB85_15520 [Mycobacteroides immunogenum]
MLTEVGYEGTSVRGVAARAGVGRASILRRWPSKAELVAHSFFTLPPDEGWTDRTDRTDWIAGVVEQTHRFYSDAEVQAALPGLIVAYQQDPELRAAIWHKYTSPDAQRFATKSESSIADADILFVLLVCGGVAMYAATIADLEYTPEVRSRVARLLQTATRPRHR